MTATHSAAFSRAQPHRPQLLRDLVTAARDGDTLEVARLLNAGVPTEAVVLATACGRGHLKVAELLIERGASVDAPTSDNGATPLMISAVWNRPKIAALLLRRSATLEPRGCAGVFLDRTALDLAHEKGSASVVELIVRARALRRLGRLRRLVPIAGRWRRFLLALHAEALERSYAPGGAGERRACAEFEAHQANHQPEQAPG